MTGRTIPPISTSIDSWLVPEIASVLPGRITIWPSFNRMRVIITVARKACWLRSGICGEEMDTDRYCLTSDYNELGSNSLKLKNYDAAINFYDRALKWAKDSASKVIVLNGKAVVYEKMAKYRWAIGIYESILGQSQKSKRGYARVMTNLAMVRWMRDPAYRAAPELLMALELRKSRTG